MTTGLRTPAAGQVGAVPPARALAPRWSGMWSLPEVRWAVLALALFAVGGVSHLAGAPSWLWWALYLACYAAGGWSPAWPG
ncbi:hypothetical protein ACFQYP_28595 [Nonomuraea antimicrobica]